jgi:cytoskeletal protein CcmA (bactofilin family)
MTCLSELTCAVYVDGELSPEEARAAERHLGECARCRTLVVALRDENRVLGATLGDLAPSAPSSVGAVMPAAVARRGRLATNGLRGSARGLILAALTAAGSLAGLAGLVGLGELPGRPAGDWIGAGVEAALFLALNAAALEGVVGSLAIATMAALALAGALYLGRTPVRAAAVLALILGAAAGLASSPAEALETRRGRDVVIAAGETVDGTLAAAGEGVRVEGTVRGDLIVAAAHVEVRGTVGGDLVVVARAVDVSGTVEGSAYIAAGSLTLSGRVGRGLYAADRATIIEAGARVGGDLALAGRSVALRGDVGRGVAIIAHDAELSGRIERDVRFRGDRLLVREPARIEGVIRADVTRATAVTVDPAVAVRGPVLTRVMSRTGVYGEPRTWFWAATGFFGAAVLGWLAILLTPALLVESADAVRS